MHNEKCWNSHIGVDWCIYVEWLQGALAEIQAGTRQPMAASDAAPTYFTTPSGTAIVSLDGPLMKARSKFGGTSTVQTRVLMRQALADPAVSSILLRIESPGGTVSGTQELAQDVRAANEIKPVFAQIEDLGASAAYWIASQARQIFANEMAMVGSIGTVAVLEDLSKAAEMKGIKVHVVSTGEFKGAGVPGAPITDAQIAHVQERVDDLNEHFLKAIKTGRNMGIDAVRKLADGKVHIAAKAQAMGLIDGVQSIDKTLRQLAGEAKAQAGQGSIGRRARAQLAIEDAE